MKRYNTIMLPDGSKEKREKDFTKLMKLYYLKYTNLTYKCGVKNLPQITCKTKVYPDYLALYSQPCTYHRTRNTAVVWYEFDETIDGRDGLFEAIYYNDEKRLNYFKERFKDVKFFFTPDYSECGDGLTIDNEYRIFKARLVAIWLTIELGAIVIPTITFPSEESFEWFLDGLEECTVVGFSTKGYVKDKDELILLKKAIKYTVDNLEKLETIIVYDVCGDYTTALDIFEYAISKGKKIVVPPNILKERNIELKEGRNNAQ